MTQTTPKWETGFIARLTFDPKWAKDYSFQGHQVVETFYAEDEDVFEFIDFAKEHEDYILAATVLMPDGKVIDAKAMSTFAEE
jgi:hypothetical protein